MCWGRGGALYERQVLFPKEPRWTRAGRQLKGWTVVGLVCSSFQKQLRAVLEGLPPHTLLSHGHLQRHHRLRTEDEAQGSRWPQGWDPARDEPAAALAGSPVRPRTRTEASEWPQASG